MMDLRNLGPARRQSRYCVDDGRDAMPALSNMYFESFRTREAGRRDLTCEVMVRNVRNVNVASEGRLFQ